MIQGSKILIVVTLASSTLVGLPTARADIIMLSNTATADSFATLGNSPTVFGSDATTGSLDSIVSSAAISTDSYQNRFWTSLTGLSNAFNTGNDFAGVSAQIAFFLGSGPDHQGFDGYGGGILTQVADFQLSEDQLFVEFRWPTDFAQTNDSLESYDTGGSVVVENLTQGTSILTLLPGINSFVQGAPSSVVPLDGASGGDVLRVTVDFSMTGSMSTNSFNDLGFASARSLQPGFEIQFTEQPDPIPAPSALLLSMLGLPMIGWVKRRYG